MNADTMQAQWAQARSAAKQRWNKLSESDLDSVRGQANDLIDLIEDRYGYSRKRAEQQVNRFMKEYGDKMQTTTVTFLETVRDFVNERPWAAVLAGVLVLGLVAGLVYRPGMRRY